ncbi:stress-activated map kinase-interacting protein 1 [Atheta coriaria]|uniref:stress-activated map kinase-interacting protein 1 n=1 Tax=Dalotia coriaria TaxID=877792 RepID=UPI0031F47700
MAFYNDKHWLLSHIRNSFISTDDTGMCEIVMEGQNLPKNLVDQLNIYPDSEDSQDDEDFNQNDSIEIPPDLDLPVRIRSDTAVRLERMDQAKKRAAKTKHIKWESNLPNDLSLVKKEVLTPIETNVKSLLSEQIVNYPNVPKNPYIEYAKFDGNAQVGIPVRRYRIFLTMLPEEQRNYPMTIVCIATAKIHELIGLICFKCSTVHGDFQLKPSENYGLYIMEEDGEIERDLGALDRKECVVKFGFTCLGLVEETKSDLDKNLASPTEETANNSLSKPQSSTTNAQDANRQQIELEILENHKTAMEAPLYKTYKVHVINRVRAKVEIQLGIVADKIEIDPVRQKSAKFIFNRHRPVSHPMESIASCEITDTKSSKSVFRIIYNPGFSFDKETPSSSVNTPMIFKHYDFETDHATAESIVQKVNMILTLRSSASRKEYLEMMAKERRYQNIFKRYKFELK